MKDAHLWLWGTEPLVEFVILAKHVETKEIKKESKKEGRKVRKKERK